MKPTPPAAVHRRRRWPWVLLVLFVTPVVMLGAAAYNYLTLDGDAALLRREITRATGEEWKTTMQISLGRVSFAALRSGFSFAQSAEIIEARDAIATLRQASVGVYQRRSGSGDWSSAELMVSADKHMQNRGWIRIVGVADGKDTVMVYVPNNAEEFDRVCVAVINATEMVVVSATIKPAALVDLVERHAGGDLQMAFAKLN